MLSPFVALAVVLSNVVVPFVFDPYIMSVFSYAIISLIKRERERERERESLLIYFNCVLAFV